MDALEYWQTVEQWELYQKLNTESTSVTRSTFDNQSSQLRPCQLSVPAGEAGYVDTPH